jgi:dTDP-4-dehydrorhamnose 3,5-epimerase
MQLHKTDFNGLFIVEPKVWPDSRGYFFESFKLNLLKENGIDLNWVQDNEASSTYGVVRGLHYQKPPFAQTKLIRAIQGSIIDTVVDLRSNEPTYGQVFSIELNDVNKLQLLVPQGFAHGYSVISETSIVQYKVDNVYNKESEGGINLLDSSLNIDWKLPANEMIISDKDLILPNFADLEKVW